MARPGLSNNRKFLRLARALGNRALARGVLELLWEPSYECGDPYVGTAEDIEAMCDWKGKPGELTRHLLDAGAPKGAGFIEPMKGEGTDPHYQIHDFFHHCPEYAKRRREREMERQQPRECLVCGEAFFSTKEDSRFCSNKCRQADYRARARVTHGVTQAPTENANENAGGNAPVTGVTDGVTHGVTDGVTGVTQRNATPAPAPAPAPAPNTRTQHAHPSPAPTLRELTTAETLARSTDPAEEAGDGRQLVLVAEVVPDAEEPLLVFPTDGAVQAWPLVPSMVREWEEVFPSLDVMAECRKALAWIKANPGKRKTERGMKAFLFSWLDRSQNRRAGATVIAGSSKTAGNAEAIRQWLEERKAR